MQYPNLFKRIIPFMLALTLGISLAYAFGDIKPRYGMRGRMYREMCGMKDENIRLKMENEDLKQQLEEQNTGRHCDKDHFSRHDLLHREEIPVLSKNAVIDKLKKETEKAGGQRSPEVRAAP